MNDSKRKYTLEEVTDKLKRWLDNGREITSVGIVNHGEDDYGPDYSFVIKLTDSK